MIHATNLARHRLGRRDIQFVDLLFGGQLRFRLAGPEEAQRDDDGARPGRHLVDVERCPLRQQDHLGRHGRAGGVRDQTQHREVIPRETVDSFDAARSQDRVARADHVVRSMIVAGNLQRQIRLHRPADFNRPARKHRPAAVRALLVEHVGRRFLRSLRMPLSEERQQQNVLRFEDRVSLQLCTPMAVVLLEREQMIASSLHRRPKSRSDRRQVRHGVVEW